MLVVVSHDAGGAELLSSYVRKLGAACLYVLEGPALAVFERKLGPIQLSTLEPALASASSVLCGTSWQSSLEFTAMGRARVLGKRTVTFLDHWVNYRERFVRDGETRLPDELWLCDTAALEMAARVLPEVPSRLVENLFFQDVRDNLAHLARSYHPLPGSISVLYVCEPVSVHAATLGQEAPPLGYDEFVALERFMAGIGWLGKPVDRIVIRPHPSEPAGKYDWARQSGLPVVRGGSKSLLEEITDCDVVVGCESMAMVLGLIAGKRVVSCIPPGGRPCVLPFPEIERFNP